MNDRGFCRTAPASPGQLNVGFMLLVKVPWITNMYEKVVYEYLGDI